jgi:PAS domain S-box-containing protein
MQHSLENIQDVVFSLNAEGYIVFAGGACMDILNRSAEQLRNIKLQEVFLDLNIDPVSQLNIIRIGKEAVSELQESINYEAKVLLNEQVKWLEIKEQFQYNHNHKLSGSTGVIRDISDRKTVELNLEKKIAEFRLLNDFGSKLSTADTVEEALYALGNQLQELIVNAGILISCCETDSNDIRMKKIYGFNGQLMKLVKLLGVNPSKIVIPLAGLSPDTISLLTNGVLNRVDDGLYPLFNGQISKRTCTITEQVLGIRRIETMGFSFNGRPKGGVSILLRKESQLENRSLVESIIKQAAITVDRLQAEYLLKENEKKYRELVEKADVAIAIDDHQGQLVFYNSEFANLFGYPEDELQNKSIRDLIHPEDLSWVIPIHRKRLLGEPAPEGYEFRGIKQDGKVIWISLKTALYIKQGIISGTRTYFWDVTERKMNEIALQKAKDKAEESDKLKSAFLKNLSHEIRTPLNGVLGFSSLLDEDNLNPILRSEYIKIIHNSGEQLAKIMDDIIDISKLEAGQVEIAMESFELNQIVRDLRSLFENKSASKGIEFKILIDPKVPDILFTDYYKAKQVLEILISNALKFTVLGHIFVKILPDPERQDRIRFEVEDTGIGIAPENQVSIFERFRKETQNSAIINGGTGLGLSIAKGMINLLGGEIGVNSQKNQGSTFFFTIPSDN